MTDPLKVPLVVVVVVVVVTAVICGDPGEPQHGSKDGHVFYYPHNVSFTCFAGYVLQGASKIQCNGNGVWTALPPVCQGMH